LSECQVEHRQDEVLAFKRLKVEWAQAFADSQASYQRLMAEAIIARNLSRQEQVADGVV